MSKENKLVLGNFEEVSLSALWGREDSDFTPWMATEGLDHLSQVLDMNLVIPNTVDFKGGTEISVGSFRADILCINGVDSSTVLIENQYGRTDHKHLGQLITYTELGEQYKDSDGDMNDNEESGLNLIWIAEMFHEKHIAAIRWLNRNTRDDVNFFAVAAQLLKIVHTDNNPPAKQEVVALKFNLVEKPNGWTRYNNRATEGKVTKIEKFWLEFDNFIQENNHDMAIHGDRKRAYISIQLNSNIHFKRGSRIGFNFMVRFGIVSVEFQTHGKNRKKFFDQLKKNRAQIDGQLGQNVKWREGGKYNSAIGWEYTEVAKDDPKEWRKLFPEIVKNIKSLSEVLPKYISD